MICFRRPALSDPIRLNGCPTFEILPDLESRSQDSDIDLTRILALSENSGVAFQGPVKVGAFDISGDTARSWLAQPNPHGRPNSDVLRPWANGQDITRRASDTWIIDFAEMPESEASLYEVPFAYVKEHVKPLRDAGRREGRRRYWWRHGETVPALRRAVAPLGRYLATSRVSKHRFFVWLPRCVLPDSRLYAIARDDDAMFGLLHSRIHVTWALSNASMHGDGDEGGRPTYNAKSCFETFPFTDRLTPAISAAAYAGDLRIQRIAEVAKRLNELRENWLNPPELVDRVPEVVAEYPDRLVPKNEAVAKELKKRTLTNLYNQNPAWLQHTHRELDEAVAAAYGWEWPLTDEEILSRLFKLNQSRAAAGR